MTQQPLYRLADSTLADPLVNSWTATWMTLAPIPSSLHVHNYQVPLLRAYLQNPGFHAKAARDRSIAGSSFVDVPPDRANEVKALLQRTLSEQGDQIKLAEAIEDFQSWLLAEAKGQSLESFYGKIPEPLQGLVELIYDYNNRPFLRLFEGATYRSRYYKPQLQSVRLSRLEADSARPVVYTSPSLTGPGQIEVHLPLSDERWDRVFGLDLEAKPLGYIRDLLGPAVKSDEELLPLLSDAPLPSPAPWDGAAPRVRYLGHATVLIEWKGVSILTDPVVAPRPTSGGMERVSFQELPRRIDYALITHNHADHLSFDTLLRLRHRLGQLVMARSNGLLMGDVSGKLLFRALGFKDVRELDAYESIPLPEGEIVATPFLGEHGDLGHAKSCFMVRTGREQMLFVADSTCVDGAIFRETRRILGEVGTVFMNTETEGAPHTWTLEALFPKKRDRKLEKNRRCRGSNVEEGLELLGILGAKRLYNYAMGLEPWVEHIIGPAAPPDAPRMKASDQLLAEARARGILAERLSQPTELRIGR